MSLTVSSDIMKYRESTSDPWKRLIIQPSGNTMYYPSQTVNVASNAEMFRITDPAITTQTVVVEFTFANPSYVTSDVTWTSYDGYIAFNGTCTAATTANVTLGNAKTPTPQTPLAIANGGTGADNAADARANLGLNWTTVWTNNSTDSDFASQTIPLDLSGYKEFVVRFTSMKTATPDASDNFEFYVSTKDVVFFCSGFANTFIRRRTMKVSDTGVLFGTGTYLSSYGSGGAWNDNNANFVPITIKAR